MAPTQLCCSTGSTRLQAALSSLSILELCRCLLALVQDSAGSLHRQGHPGCLSEQRASPRSEKLPCLVKRCGSGGQGVLVAALLGTLRWSVMLNPSGQPPCPPLKGEGGGKLVSESHIKNKIPQNCLSTEERPPVPPPPASWNKETV